MQLQTVLIVVLAVIVLAVLGIIILLPTQAPIPAALMATPVPQVSAPEKAAPAQVPVQPQTQIARPTSLPVAPANLHPMGQTVTGPETAAAVPMPATQ